MPSQTFSRVLARGLRTSCQIYNVPTPLPPTTSSVFTSSSLFRRAHPSVLCKNSRSALSSEVTSKTINEKQLPTKETLLRIDWILEHITPSVLKSRMKTFFDICNTDLQFEDKLHGYTCSQRSQLLTHLAKIRMYFRYRSPYNKVEHIGSCIYDGEDVIVLLWRLSTLESNMWSYLPSFITKKETKINTVEGACDIHITPDGYVYKIMMRKITASDREGANVMRLLKEDGASRLSEQEAKEMRHELEDVHYPKI